MINIAITGTKGKTTILYLIRYVLRKLNKNVMIASSTEGVYYNETFVRNPQSLTYLNKDNYEIDFFISEATSKLLENNKYENEKIDIAIYTGIEEREHLETHETFDRYLKAKSKLLQIAEKCGAFIFVNNNDNHIYDILRNVSIYNNLYFCGEFHLSKVFDFFYVVKSFNENNMSLVLNTFSGNININSKLTGDYNASNILFAVLALQKCGIDIKDIKNNIETFTGVPGRFQIVNISNGCKVIIDYAHTENSLKLVLQHIKELYKDKKIITIFGCGGERTPQKRSYMGKIACEYSDFVYVTTDNPRKESQKKIFDDIVKDIDEYNYMIIENRQDALEQALNIFDENSIILLAGKGSETENIDLFHGTYILSDFDRIKNVCNKLNIKIL